MVDRLRIRQEGYDSTTGVWTRNVRGTDIENLTVVNANPGAGVTVLSGSIVVGADEVGLLVGIDVSADAAGRYHVRILEAVDDRIVFPAYLDNTNFSIPAGDGVPLAVAASGSTITQFFTGDGSTNVSASIAVKMIPNKDKLETE